MEPIDAQSILRFISLMSLSFIHMLRTGAHHLSFLGISILCYVQYICRRMTVSFMHDISGCASSNRREILRGCCMSRFHLVESKQWRKKSAFMSLPRRHSSLRPASPLVCGYRYNVHMYRHKFVGDGWIIVVIIPRLPPRYDMSDLYHFFEPS